MNHLGVRPSGGLSLLVRKSIFTCALLFRIVTMFGANVATLDLDRQLDI